MNKLLTGLFLLVLSFQGWAQTNGNTATGIVRNADGEVLHGAVVRLENESLGFHQTANTNEKGIFSISSVPPGGGYQFIITHIGYVSDTLTGYEMKANGRISLSVTLKNHNSDLDKVVVIGYGSVRKKDLSAAVSDVSNMDEIKERPVVDVPNMIQGQVPGVTVVANGGHPDQVPSVVIRGVGSTGTENVLYVVDGVPNAPYNPADVVSITILKDAASAAIYGAFSGSAGVIMITTRQAGKGGPSIDYTAFAGAKTAWRLPQSLTAAKTAEVANLASKNAGQTPLDGWDAAKNPYDQVTRTDWMHSIFRTGLVHRHNIAVNAGTDKFSTLFEGRYEENEGTLLNTYNKNISGRMNANYTFNPHIKFKQDVFVNSNDNRDAETSSGYSGVILSAIYMPRSAVVRYDDGSFGGTGPIGSQYNGIHGDAINPVATLLRNTAYNKTIDMQSISELKISNIVPGLSFLTRFSYRSTNWLYKDFEPKRPEPGKPNNQNTLTYSTSRERYWIWENTANYDRRFGRHNLSLMASTTSQEDLTMGFSASGKTFDNEATWAQFFVNAASFEGMNPTDYENKDRNESYVGRLAYSYADRYFVTGSYRYDIAGRLAAGYRGKGLPGVTAAWKISSEPFFHVSAVNLLKVRASWGRIGNLGSIGYYYGYPSLTSDNTYQIGNGAPYTPVLYQANGFTPNLSWETSEQKDLGLDVSLLDNRLDLTVDYFDKKTFDLIQPQANNWPNTLGLGRPLVNQGSIRNKGLEVSATWKGNIGRVSYDINGNIATLKNRVEYIDGNPHSIWAHTDNWRGTMEPFQSTVGQPFYSYWLIKTAGIFQNQQEVDNYVGKDGTKIQPNARPGDLKFVDKDGDGKITDKDRMYMGSAAPKFTYGFTANVRYHGFDISLFMQGVSGVKLFHAFKESTLNGSEQGYNRWDKILNAWSPTNTKSNIPIISANDPNNNFQTVSDWYLENGSYLRVKSLIIGYTFPKFIKKSSLRVYISGDNLLTFTKYSGMDPEVGGHGLDGGQFPVSRIYATGVKLTL